jgi:hypothetical protein
LGPVPEGASYSVRAFKAREPLESGADRTVPPSISLMPPVVLAAKPRRRAFAVGSLGALCLATAMAIALVRSNDGSSTSTPPTLAADTTAASPPSAPALDIATPAVTAAAPAETEPPAPIEKAEEVPAVVVAPTRKVATRSATEASAKPLVARPLVAGLGSSATDSKHPWADARHPWSDAKHPWSDAKSTPTVTRAQEIGRAQATASRTMVHGGLSSPGF